MPKDSTQELQDATAALQAIRERLFNMANSQAGNNKGNAALFLHEASNKVANALSAIDEAKECLDRGNPPEVPPFRFIASAIGLTH